MNLSGPLSREALGIVQGGDRTVEAYQRLSKLAAEAERIGDEAQITEVGAFVEAFIADGGEFAMFEADTPDDEDL